MIRALGASLRPLRFWIGLAVAQVLLGWFLYCFLPPEPRWALPAGIVDRQALDHGKLITVAWNEKNEPVGLRDPYTGNILQRYFADLHPDLLLHPGGDAGNSLIACVESNTLHVASIADGKAVATCPLGEGTIQNALLSPDARFVTISRQMSANEKDTRFSLIEIATQKKLFEVEGEGKAYFNPQGDMVAATLVRGFDNDGSQFAVKVWNVQTGECILDLVDGAITRWPWTNGFDRDGRTLSMSVGDSWQVWDVVQRKCVLKEPTLCKGVERICSSDGRFAVFTCLRDRASTVRVWDHTSEAVVFDRSFDDEVVIAISPDNSWLAVQSGPPFGPIDLSLYEIKTGRCLWSTGRAPLSLFEAPPPIFTADGQHVVVYRSDKAPLEAHYFDVRSGQLSLVVPVVAPVPLGSVYVFLTESPKVDLAMACHKRSAGVSWLDEIYKYLGIRENEYYANYLVDKEAKTSRRLSSPMVNQGSVHVWLERQLLVGLPPHLERSVYEAWDFDGHGPWRWVLGVPAVFGALVVACRCMVRRVRPKASD